jgi:hypothetical protein
MSSVLAGPCFHMFDRKVAVGAPGQEVGGPGRWSLLGLDEYVLLFSPILSS